MSSGGRQRTFCEKGNSCSCSVMVGWCPSKVTIKPSSQSMTIALDCRFLTYKEKFSLRTTNKQTSKQVNKQTSKFLPGEGRKEKV